MKNKTNNAQMNKVLKIALITGGVIVAAFLISLFVLYILDIVKANSEIKGLPQGFMPRVVRVFERYGMSMIYGAGRTIIIAFISTAIGCIIGFLCGAIQTIPTLKNDNIFKKIILGLCKTIIYIYVEVFRGTPMMVQAMFIYYGAAMCFGIDMSMWFAALFIVSINTGAYMTETVRGGIDSIDIGQFEGAKSIGMNHWKTMYYVVLPQALRNVMPQIGNNFIINIKDTCVLSVISVVELFFASKGAAGALYAPFEVYTITMVIYLIMTVSASRILRLLEDKMDGPENFDLSTTDTLAHTSGMFSSRRKKEAAK